MIIQKIPSGPFDTNTYVIACSATRQAMILDPAPECSPYVISYIAKNNLTPIKIVLTHSHWDHIAETSRLKQEYTVPVSLHALDAGNLEKPGSDGLPCWISIPGVKPDELLKEGDHIQIGELDFKVIETPGHTPGGICLYCEKEKVLFSGDTLFKGTIGNLSFTTARPQLMQASLNKLANLPKETVVYPGHGPSTTIAEEPWLSRASQLFGF